MSENDCIFCKIVKGEIPSYKIYEDGEFLAFLDIKPVSDGHLLIIPKKHIVWMQDADDETTAKIFNLSKKIMVAMKKGLPCDYVLVSIVGTEVPHFHIHLIPRMFDDGMPEFPTKNHEHEKAIEVAKKITSAL